MNGPEKPALIERIVRLVPLPYTLAALVWALIVGSPVFHLLEYLDMGRTTFSLAPAQLYADLLFTLIPFYSFYSVNYLRRNILRGESQIIDIMTEGETGYHRAFGRFGSKPPVILLTILLTPLAFQATITSLRLSILPVATTVLLVINTFAIASLIWTYAICSWGLHQLGESKLQLKSFLEDRLMGGRPIGSIALSSTLTYFGTILLVFLLFQSYFLSDIAFEALLILLIALGVFMFFLPLNSIHKQLRSEKIRYQKELNTQLLVIKQAGQTSLADGPPSMERMSQAITELFRLKDLEITERRLASAPTWPFDVQLIVKLITIVLSVTAALLARVIINFLRL